MSDYDVTQINPHSEKTWVLPANTLAGKDTTLPLGTRASAQEPQQVGRYKVLDRIGRGGMASVFRAYDPEIDRVIAIKFLHSDLCSDEDYRARFLREARASGKLSHPNIVAVYDVGEIEGRPYIAMELVEGEPFNEVITKAGRMSVREVLESALQLARALDYAHGRGLVHRDIKPANVMRLQDGHALKVMDFGIAHFESSDYEATRRGDVLGTPQYMSPEQTMGATLDGRSDLFSVGILLYYMLAGRVPFQENSLIAIGMKIVNDPPPPLEGLRPDVPLNLLKIVYRCLEKQPAQRFQSGNELAQAVLPLLRELDGDIHQPLERVLVPLRLRWALAMAAFVLTVMSITGAVIYQQQRAAMMAQVTDYGASLGRFIAAENAAAALDDEWPTIEVSVQEIMKTGDFANLQVMDSAGVVKAASDEKLLGKPFNSPVGESLGSSNGGIKIRRYQQGDKHVLGFAAPITFQGKTVGFVDLGIAEQPLVKVARLSLILMCVLVLVTVSAVAVAMYFIADWFAGPARMLRIAMREFQSGQLDYRITDERKDEYGLLYSGFNSMANVLQKQLATTGVTSVNGSSASATTASSAQNASPKGV